MNDATGMALQALAEHVSAVERDFLELGKLLDTLDESKGRMVTLAAYRAVHRVAEAGRAVKAKCPKCGRPDSKLEYEAVNKLSGVWKLPDCPTCTELSQLIAAVEKAVRATARTAG
jgi:hypothetical protein